MKKKTTYFLSLLAILFIIGGYIVYSNVKASQSVIITAFAMDTYMRVEIQGKDASKAGTIVEEEIKRLENLLAVNRTDSEVYALNHSFGKATKVSEDTLHLAKISHEYSQLTDGAFDITMYPVTSLWGFTTGQTRVPEASSIEEALLLTGMEKLFVEGESITLSEGAEIDFGAIAKGYLSDCIAGILDNYRIATALINLGGNVYTYHTKADGSLYNVGIENPLASDNSLLGTVKVSDKAVVTSGKNKRFFEKEGRKYWHIFDPDTGTPADAGLFQATIIADSGAYADALSTAVLVRGSDFARSLKAKRNDFEYVLVTDEGEIIASELSGFEKLK